MTSTDPVVVVGAGITGLVAAYRLTQRGIPNVVLESDTRSGGKLHTQPFVGAAVETGPDAMLARVPWGVDLLAELGIPVIAPATGKAYVWWNNQLNPIPDGLVLGVPAGLVGLARSPLLSLRGKLRASVEPVLPRRDPDDNLGTFIRGRFGSEVAERLVDPLIGGINAGDADRLSLSASAPQIADAAQRHRSLLVGLRRNRPATAIEAPVFLSPVAGFSSVVDALLRQLPDVRMSSPAVSVERTPNGWLVNNVPARAVILATPAFVSSNLLATHSPEASRLLGAIDYASVAMVTLAFPRNRVSHPLDAAGYLVPKPQQRHITACSFGSTKWPHWATDDHVVLRVSLGRFGDTHALTGGDNELIGRAVADIRTTLGLTGDPADARVTRWPRSFPQYEPGHQQRIEAIRCLLATDTPGVVVAGAAFDGVGIPACIRQAEQAISAIQLGAEPN